MKILNKWQIAWMRLKKMLIDFVEGNYSIVFDDFEQNAVLAMEREGLLERTLVDYKFTKKGNKEFIKMIKECNKRHGKK